MQFFCAFLIVALPVFFFSVEANLFLQQAIKRCGDGMDLKEDDILKPFRERFQNPMDDSMKCFFKCMMQTEKWMTEDGEIRITPEIKNFEKCTKMGDNACERAFHFHKCVYDNNGDRIFEAAIE